MGYPLERFAAGSAQTKQDWGRTGGKFGASLTQFVLYASELSMASLQCEQLADFVELPLVSDCSVNALSSF